MQELTQKPTLLAVNIDSYPDRDACEAAVKRGYLSRSVVFIGISKHGHDEYWLFSIWPGLFD